MFGDEASAMNQPTTPVEDVLDLIRVLVFIQILVIFATAIEGLIFGAFAGAPGPGLLTATAGLLTAWAYRGLLRRSARARIWLIRYQRASILLGVIDLFLAIFVAGRWLGLVPTLTRLVLPWVLIRFLKRPDVIDAMETTPELPSNHEEPVHVLA